MENFEKFVKFKKKKKTFPRHFCKIIVGQFLDHGHHVEMAWAGSARKFNLAPLQKHINSK